MIKKSKVKLMSGNAYYLEQEDYDSFVPESAKLLQSELKPFVSIGRGNIIPNPEYGNRKIIFDLVQDDDFYGASFRGFLYDNKTFMGKVIWSRDAKSPDESFQGEYYPLGDNGIILKGLWTDPDNVTLEMIIVME